MKNFKFLTLLSFLIIFTASSCILNRLEGDSKNNEISIDIQPLRGAKINLNLSNNGSSDLVFLNIDTPINGHLNEYFKITNENGDEVPYVGLLSYVDMASAKWSKLNSGENINIPVDLSKDYDFSNTTGTYTITYLHDLNFTKGNNDSRNAGYDPSKVERITLASNELEIEISDINDIRNENLRSLETTRFSCSAEKTPHAEAAKAKAMTMTSDTISYMKKNKMDSLWNTWWGVDNNSRYEFILNTYGKILTSFGESWSYDCPEEGTQSSCDGVTAQVVKGSPYKVRLCPSFFWQNSYQVYQGKVLVHEASHWNIIIGAFDYAYWYDGCQNLAKNDPEKATMNADNYGMFSYRIAENDTTNDNDDDDDNDNENDNEHPVADFSYSVNKLNVQFTDKSTDSDGKITKRKWDFGDGKTSTAKNPDHSFSKAGTYTVELKVTDDGGLSRYKSKKITLKDPSDNDDDNDDDDEDDTDNGCGGLSSIKEKISTE